MATVGPNCPVTINYSLSLEGVSSSREYLQFIYVDREIFLKLEQAFAWLSLGEERNITLSPNDAMEK
jgi:FKBP-type peptidyl-prolyl cis-trans isomerase 2